MYTANYSKFGTKWGIFIFTDTKFVAFTPFGTSSLRRGHANLLCIVPMHIGMN